MYIIKVDTCPKLLSVLQVSTTGNRQLLDPPEQMTPVALLRTPDVSPPTSGIFLTHRRTRQALPALRVLHGYLGGAYFLVRLGLRSAALIEAGW